MVLTEADLAPYRDIRGLVRPSPLSERSVLIENAKHWVLQANERRDGVPEAFLTPTHDVFETNWQMPEPPHAPQEALQAIPVLAFRKAAPVLNPALEWWGLLHQCGGLLCHQMSMIATRLRPRREIAPHLNAIVRTYYDADDGYLHERNLNPRLVSSYKATLQRLGLNCEASWENLNEAAYPIDATQANLERIAEGGLRLSEMADWQDEPQKNAVILLLTWNSD